MAKKESASREYKDEKNTNNGAQARNKRRNRRGRTGGGSSKGDTSMLTGSDGKLTGNNDISWYSRYPSLLTAAGSIPYPIKPGMTVNLGTVRDVENNGSWSATETVPGVACLDWIPSVGRSLDVLSPASVACKELWSKIRQSYGSTTLAADPPDLMIYLMALDSIYAYIGWLKSVYRSLDAFTPTNHSIPEGILYAKGFTNDQIQNLRENRSHLWYAINTLVHYTWKFTCPDVMAVFKRHYWLSDNVFTDAPSSSSQLYMFNLRGVFKFKMLPIPSDPSTLAGGLELTFLDVSNMSSDNIVANLFAFGQELISSLAESEDGYTIAGYFAKAFDGVPSFMVSELEVGETISLQYSEEVLSQIENSTGLANSNWASLNNFLDGNVYQEPLQNAIIHRPAVVSGIGGKFSETRPWISIRSDAPNVEDTAIATRLKVRVAKVDDSRYDIVCGTEIPWCWRYWWREADPLRDNPAHPNWRWLAASAVEIIRATSGGTIDREEASHITECMFMKSQWDWAPLVLVAYTDPFSTPSYLEFTTLVGDMHNTTSIEPSTLEELHRVCLYSEFSSFDY